MNLKHAFIMTMIVGCIGCESQKKTYASYEDYPVPSGELNEMNYSPQQTVFNLWSPDVDEVKVLLYDSGDTGSALKSLNMVQNEEGVWSTSYEGDLMGKFYAFNVKKNGRWLGDTPGIMAKAVGVNGRRAAIIDMASTNPDGWRNDDRPPLNNYGNIMIYEMHHRDFSIDSLSGIERRGKYLALTEEGTKTIYGESTGIDHLKELGITHVHLLPSADYASVDETHLERNQYNWGV